MTDLLLTSVRFALFAALIALTGLAAFPLHALRPAERRKAPLVRIFTRPLPWLCALALLLSATGIAVLTASMQGVALSAVDGAMLLVLVGETDVGTAWLYRMVALLVAAGAALGFARSPMRAATVTAAAGAIALATLAWSGHAAAGEGLVGTVQRIADVLHLLAAAVWLGAIAAFLVLLSPHRRSPIPTLLAARSLDRFARTGTLCVLVIAATGLVNGQLIFGIENASRLPAGTYGQLLLVKLLLFAAMLALAAANRWRLTPALAASLTASDPGAATRAIRRSLSMELFSGAAILALVAWFGTLEPFVVG